MVVLSVVYFDNMSIHLTIKNKNCSNPRTAMPEIVAGDMIRLVVGKKCLVGVRNLVKKGL